MPNHVTNKIIIRGDALVLKTLELEVQGLGDDGEVVASFDFNQIIPTPDDVFQGNLSFEEQVKTRGRNWYDWNRQNWGTKWNAYNFGLTEIREYSLTFVFDTAWSPPTPVIKTLAQRFPEVDIKHHFIDEGGNFAGTNYYHNGELQEVSSIECSLNNEEYPHFYRELYGELPNDWELSEKEF